MTVVLGATGSGNTLTQPAAGTDANGVATGTVSSTVAEAKTISATINGIAITQTAGVTVTAAAPSASQSLVAAAPASITAGSGSATITVTAKDANGNLISGMPVVLAATGSGNTLTQPAVVTDVNGVATGTLSSTVAEAKTISATINGIAITQTAGVTVTAAAPSASQSLVAAAPASITAGSGSATVTVTAKDANGNLISGATVVLQATGSGNTVTHPAAVTGADGVATGTVSSTVSEAKTVSAAVSGILITQTAAVTVTPGPAASLSFTAQPSDIAAGALMAPGVQVTALDAAGNRATSFAGTVSVALGTPTPNRGRLYGTRTVTAAGGVAVFSDLTVDSAAIGYTLQATN